MRSSFRWVLRYFVCRCSYKIWRSEMSVLSVCTLMAEFLTSQVTLQAAEVEVAERWNFVVSQVTPLAELKERKLYSQTVLWISFCRRCGQRVIKNPKFDRIISLWVYGLRGTNVVAGDHRGHSQIPAQMWVLSGSCSDFLRNRRLPGVILMPRPSKWCHP